MPRRVAVACAVLVAAVVSLGAATAKSMYDAAFAREHAVRAKLEENASNGPAVLKEIRSIENAYLSLVRRYPTSGYADDALWNAGHLALDAYAKFGEVSDRETGLHFLTLLASQYPTSKLAKRVPEQIAAAPPPPYVSPAPPASRATAPQASPATGSSARQTPAEPPLSQASTSGATAANADGPPARHTIHRVTREVLPDVVRVIIDMDEEVPFHEERIENPPRVFVDFPSTRATASLLDKTLRFESDADLVRQIRFGRQPNGTTRVVLDAAGVTGYSIYSLYNPYRLVIDCARVSKGVKSADALRAASTQPSKTPAVVPAMAPKIATTAPAPKPIPPPKIVDLTPPAIDGIRLSTTWGRKLPSVSPRSTALIQRARTESDQIAAAPAEAAAPLAPPALMAPPSPNVAGGFSMARQLGLGVSRIVIDPGHGGHDPGAKGKGVTEAEVVLDVALRLEKLLQEKPGVEVVLTRRTDDFIQLQDRTAIANRESADLFLSIHANASTSATAHGIETFFLNFANNLSAAAVAARENAASGQAMSALPDYVKMIALNNKLDESRDFAGQVQRAMIEKLRGSNKTLRDLGVKQAPFVVLIGASMPSILAEISFITNPNEAKLLKSGAYRQKIAEALLAAIQKYQTSLKTVSTIAHQ